MDDQPITPHASPVFDADGNLTYVGDDGRRYVVGPIPEADESSVDRVMELLRSGNTLFNQIEALSSQWLERVTGAELDRRAALVLLLTTLETALEDEDPDQR
ncbi:hypothetical protein [Vulcanococcus limneticus]|uniref:hypothetical protein n=1 Tax=Vulcanococcus limneticus TaxID=2170428 RepID=UPI000B9813D9|nr:hypothetical protein [Vulcanococcus limneticus]MCP9793217.1 hypothetical protein [Vulcanococcus limneticus MW73D5]MCP9895162.1 hypothetical protein [Vulcanococcus limneticus Candia 3F8]MCP9898615.1 hypothetical protein [Vulcanococcus limneticus Candia 3B3]